MRDELIIGGRPIDTIEGLEMNLTKEVYSIIDPSKRKSDFTKTVKIPGSKNNDNVFSALFDVNFSIRNDDQLNPDFNPSKKASCVYKQDTFQQIKGYCQLDKITILENNKVEYSIVIYGQVRNLFSDIANLTLNDLTTLGTAVWDDASIIASWTDVFVADVKPCYPYLNRGKADFNRGGVIAEWSYNYDAFKPWMYVAHIINAIIYEAGYTYGSSFFNTEQFQRLIVECDIKKFQMNETQKASSIVNTSRSTDQVIVPVNFSAAGNLSAIWAKQIQFNITASDPLLQFDATTGTITIDPSLTGVYYNIETSFTASVAFSGATGFMGFLILVKRGSSYLILGPNATASGNCNTLGTSVVTVQMSIDSFKFESGDQIRVCVGNFTDQITGAIRNADVTGVTIAASSTFDNSFLAYVDGQIEYGQTYDIAAVLPNMKQSDFLMGIFKLYNIFVDFTPTEAIILEPRDDYFTDERIDWTDKLDVSRDFNIVPQGLLENKEILFTYTGNEDDISRAFKQSTGYEFGYKRKIFDNDFVKDKRELVLPFSLMPLRRDTDFGNVNMITLFDGQGAEKSTAPILAYYGNMKPGRMVYWEVSGPTRVEYNEYPYAGPIDDVINPSYDLAFAIQDYYFHVTPSAGGLNITNNNAYNQFHARQWTEISDKDSKLIECYLKLNADDIQALSFQPLYWIDKAYYRLLGVYDHNPNGKTTTLCRFLKIIAASAIEPAVEFKPGGNGQGGETNPSTIFDDINSGRVVPRGNIISPNTTGVAVTGYGNQVGEGSRQIIIHGNSNTIMAGVQNVALINTDNLVISESNQVYIDGIKVEVGSPNNGDVWTYNGTDNKIEMQPPSGGPGAVDWGDIGGTLSDQTDLQAALDAKQDDITGFVFTSNADGFQIAGGTTPRTLLLTGGDVNITGSGSNTFTFPSVTDTLVGNKSDPAAKCWAKVAGDGTSILSSYNITSITDTGPGDVTITIATDFSSANWAALATVERINSTTSVTNSKKVNIKAGSQTAGAVALQCWDSTATNNVVEDPASWHFIGFGAQ